MEGAKAVPEGRDDKLRQKALMYVFGKRYPNIVKVNEFSRYYKVTCETKAEPGKYYTVEIPNWEDGIDNEVRDALKVLRWIEAGNEFPT